MQGVKAPPVIIYDIANEDDDFYDLDKDDLATIIGNMQASKDGETLPMPILASGFDFDDYVPDYKKGRNF